jgi:tetratricopeptide (TPR) repeat protein
MKVMISTALLTVFLLLSQNACCDDSVGWEELFKKGNSFYESGQYEDSIDTYKGIISSGITGANIYFNLGNAYYRSGDPVKALISYERAMRLSPLDPDMRSNREYMMNVLSLPESLNEGLLEWPPLKGYFTRYNLDELTVVSSSLYVISFIIFFLAIFVSKRRRVLLVIGLIVVLASSLNSYLIYEKFIEYNSASIAVDGDTEVFYGPLDSATVFFKLKKGMKVNINAERDGWYKITRHDGKSGWIKKGKLTRI